MKEQCLNNVNDRFCALFHKGCDGFQYSCEEYEAKEGGVFGNAYYHERQESSIPESAIVIGSIFAVFLFILIYGATKGLVSHKTHAVMSDHEFDERVAKFDETRDFGRAVQEGE